MGRIGRVLGIWQTNWAANPAARGAAKMAAGAALMLEGSLGMRARLRGNSGGLAAAFLLILFGVVFFSIGYFLRAERFDDEIVVQGTIIGSESHWSQDSKGRSQQMFTSIYGYKVNGKDYSFPSSVSSSSADSPGTEVTLAYSASRPEKARRLDGFDGNFHLIFQGIGGFVVLIGFYQMMISFLLIGAGLALFYAGRQERSSSGTVNGFFKDLLSLVYAEKAQREILFGELSDDDDPIGEPPATSMPPAGWMLDPENSGQMRWWDGAGWTDMYKPVESALTDTGGW